MKFRPLLHLALVLAAGLPLPAQTVTSLRQAGPRANRLNFVFLGDGYTAAEAAKFNADATAKLDVLLGNEAWSRFADLINADALFVASAESGADDPATGTVRDTYFNSTFGLYGIDRLLGIDAPGKMRMLTLLTDFAPDYDLVILLVNAAKYGGSGGFPTISSMSPDSNETVLHELGHSFAALTDEYVDPTSAAVFPIVEYANATQKTATGQIPWRNFIQPSTAIPTASAPDENTVGLFPGSHYRATGFYRPTGNSKMRTLYRPFGPVNLRAFATGLHRFNLNSAVTPPVVTTPPADAVVAPGQAFTLTVNVSGTGPFTYQWLFNSLYLVNATESSLTIPAMSPAHAGTYAVEVTNAFASVTSAAATITQAPPPASPPHDAIISPPGPVVLMPGGTVTWTVTAGGTPPFTYQWKKNGVNLSDGGSISGATTATLVLSNVGPADAGGYRVDVTNSVGQATSPEAVLALSAPPTIQVQPASQSVVPGGSVAFTATATGLPSPVYQWQKNGVNLANGGRISGATSPTLNLSGVTPADAGTYAVVATNPLGSVVSQAAQLTLSGIPSFLVQPAAQTAVVAGGSATMTVSAAGIPAPVYQWRKNGINLTNGGRITGATGPTLVLSNVTPADAGSYSVVATNVQGTCTSSQTTLVVVPP